MTNRDSIIPRIKVLADCRDLFRRFWPENHRERGNSVCPFHADSPDGPSILVERDHAHCFACNKNWDAIDLFAAGTGVELKEAIVALGKEFNLLLDKPAGSNGGTSGSSKPKSFVDTWGKLVKNPLSEDARKYLEETRRLPGIIETLTQKYLLGFNPTWKQNRKDTETVQAIAFPIIDHEKKSLLGIQYIRIDGKGKKFEFGTNASEGFFIIGDGGDYSVVTEGVVDALSVLWACEKHFDVQVICTLSASTHQKIQRIGGMPVLFLDNDIPGIMATIKAAISLSGNVRVVDWKDRHEKDVNDLLKAGHADTIRNMVKHSRSLQEDTVLNRFIISEIGRMKAMVEKESNESVREKTRKQVERFEMDIQPCLEKKECREPDPVKRRILDLNHDHAVLMMGSKCVIMQEYEDPTFNRKDLRFLGIQDFKNFYANEKYWVENGNGKLKAHDIGTLWFESPHRRQYNGIAFFPGKDCPTFYNLFRGFALQPQKGDWSKFQEHIYDIIANRHQEVFNYVIAWMAQLVQSPGGERPGISLVLRGPQGAGKGCFVSQIGKILGTHYLHITNSKQLTGRFNNHLKDALLVFCDEGVWAGDKSIEGVLKAMVTEEYMAVEPKGKDVFMVKNHLRLIIASNNDWVVPAGLEERRFCVLDISRRRIQDRRYFKEIFHQMDNGGREAMLHDLLEVDVSNVDWGSFPRTEALVDQIIRTMKTSHKFWYERLRQGALSKTETDWNSMLYESDWHPMIQTQKMHSEYIEFANEIGDRYPSIDSIFSRDLKELCPQVRRCRIRLNGDRMWVLRFPPLNECRKYFEEILRVRIPWENDSS